MRDVDLIIHGASQLLTLAPERGDENRDDAELAELGAVAGGAVAVRDGTIVDAAGAEKIRDSYRAEREIDAGGGVVLPGLVDPHTHAVFAGSRHLEFGMRMRGAGYLEILEAGGGIHATVNATRAASLEELVAAARPRLARALGFGVTTMEIKSGYGLDEETEIRMLEAVAALHREGPVRLVPTYLGAHVVPREHADRRGEYVRRVVGEVLPAVARRELALACDVFLDDGAFETDEAREILTAARDLGLATKIHAGQFSDRGGPELISELGGLSAEHLEHVSDAGVAAMAKAEVVANLLPGAAFSLRDHFPSGRRFLDAGVRVALATDNNPGSSRSENLPLMAAMGVARMGLTCAEAVRAVTRDAARALGIEERVGSLEPGKAADIVVLGLPDFRAFLYHFGVNHVRTVVAGGEVVVQGGAR